MYSDSLPSGESKKAKRPLRKSPWFWASMVILAISLVIAIFLGVNAYHFPCTISGNITGYFPCDASPTARWIAAIREGAKGLGCLCCGYVVLAALYVLKRALEDSKTKKAASSKPTLPDPQ